MSDPEAILAYRAENSVEGRSLAMHLDDAGITAHVVGESLYNAYPGVGFSRPPTEVWISPQDADRAKPLIKAWILQHPATAGDDKPQRFQFSLLSALSLTTIVAILAFAARFGPEVFSNSIAIAFMILELALVWYFFRRRRRIREAADDDTV